MTAGKTAGKEAAAAGADGTRTVDAHHHVWDLRTRDQEWLAADGLAPLRRNLLLADPAPEAAAARVYGI